jgi:hypothetical protein
MIRHDFFCTGDQLRTAELGGGRRENNTILPLAYHVLDVHNRLTAHWTQVG